MAWWSDLRGAGVRLFPPMSLLVSARGHVLDNWRRLLRYCGTSAVGVVLGQTILRVCYDLFGWSA